MQEKEKARSGHFIKEKMEIEEFKLATDALHFTNHEGLKNKGTGRSNEKTAQLVAIEMKL